MSRIRYWIGFREMPFELNDKNKEKDKCSCGGKLEKVDSNYWRCNKCFLLYGSRGGEKP